MKQAGQQENNPRMLAAQFLRAHQASGSYLREPIERLASFASSTDEAVAKEATGAIFTSLIEHLADSFEPQAVTLYNRLFAQLIQFSRQLPAGKALDAELTTFGLATESAVLARAEQLRQVHRLNWSAEAKRDVKRVIVLSRVTIGADVAITSVIMARLKREYPQAQIALVGDRKAREIFGGDSRLRFDEIHYRRAGTLQERLVSWFDVLRAVRSLIDGLDAGEYLIVDPDSRLTQLGLLPLLKTAPLFPDPASKAQINDAYLFFPSRDLGGSTRLSLSELTSIWLDAVFGSAEKTMPYLELQAEDRKQVKALVQRIRRIDARPLVAINFGVGENPMKRVSGDFEKQLVSHLLRGGAKIILDKGAGDAEIGRADAVIEEMLRTDYQGRAIRTIEVDETQIATLLTEQTINTDVLVWRGRLGILAALISESDLYIGYDSAGQHIAAALGTPCLDVFAGYSSPRMLERWQPAGQAETRVIAVDTLHEEVNTAAVLEETLAAARAMLR